MYKIALVLFVLAALAGATLAYMRIVKKDVSMPLAIVHGIFAAAGLVTLSLGVTGMGGGGATAALIVFLLAAIGGFTLFSFHLRTRPLPVPLVLIHGIAAVAAFVLLQITVTM